MSKGRLEAFSDGVIAVIITIMVLEMKPPPSPSAAALVSAAPAFLTYLLNFVFVGGIYWNNYHHLLHAFTTSMARSFGPTCISSFGYHSLRSSPPGWARITWRQSPWRHTEACCFAPRSPIAC
jgi:hypothetical protein